MDNLFSISKSELLTHDTSKESAHSNLLSDAMDFVKTHPVETGITAVAAVATVAVVAGAYNAGKLAANASRRSGAEADKLLSGIPELGSKFTHPERGVNNITIGYGDPFFQHSVADQVKAGEQWSQEAVDAQIHKLLTTDEGQNALRHFAQSDGMREMVAQIKGNWNEVMPGKPFKLWSDLPHENTAEGTLENFFRKELGDNFGHDIPMKTWTDEQKKLIAALRDEPQLFKAGIR